MLPPWLIEKTRENERRREGERTPLHIPAPPPPQENRPHREVETDERGSVEVCFIL